MVDDYHINLIKKYLDNQCSPAEKLEIETWFEHYSGGDRTFYNNDSGLINDAMFRSLVNIRERITASETTEVDGKEVRLQPKFRFRYAAIAATVLLFIVAGSYLAIHKKAAAPKLARRSLPKADTPRSTNKAILTLANGKKIVLDDAKSGKLAVQGNSSVTKAVDGRIIYKAADRAASNDEVAYNTITTPNGGQYQVVLPDGSNVWLDAASSITYPSAFTGNKRQVKLTGQAYFEVAKNHEKPFLVNVDDKQQIEVLGTHFNIQAYPDDRDVKTTLLEGSVKLTYKNNHAILKPGQMAVNAPDQALLIKQADVYEVMAWKNNMFVFNNENIKSIMKRLARWYDIDVAFNGNMENVNFFGNYSRSKGLSNLLRDIELIDKVHFKIKGRRVTVTAP
ncbi:FecR family protein [Mucilaginibacter sabulilitoris]|uniref:FecR family protein n=1 Tax=Mucilaginibacter sabulilitoris TaxID=1173583 RepID=A0ABZ0TLC2_9SPHI|nr:FecR family protein [Mucilaginibacter sabulilitoris]WPU93217.1 FecR family protein [Mucilaginibacter sabulilitoris]